jgi:hypothetical protein
MTESDRIIIYGIVSVIIIAILMIITAILLEKKIKNNNIKWLIYAIIFLVGVIIYLIFPMSETSGGNLDLSLGTVIGLCISGFTVFTVLTVYFMYYEASIAKRMIENAIRFGKELNLHINGIPKEKNVHFTKLGFSWSGRLDNRWELFHYDEIRAINSVTVSNNKPRKTISYYHYKVSITQNKDAKIIIFSNIELNKHNFLEYETVITPYPDLNEKVIIYIKSGKEKILKKLEDSSFRKLLLDNYLLFMDGLYTNSEQGIVYLSKRKGFPNYGFFTDNYKLEMDYHVANKKAHLQFLKNFMEYFDN